MMERSILALALIGIVRAYIEVTGPQNIKNKLYNQKFKNEIWTFGPIPFDSSINGTVSMFKKNFGCDPSSELTVKPTADNPVIVVVAYGGCSLPDKVINAQKAGASFVVFAEFSWQINDRLIHERKDTTTQITIPSTRLLYRYGQSFTDLILGTTESIQISVTFNVTQWSKPEILLKANILNRDFLKTLVEMNSLYPNLLREISILPTYEMMKSSSKNSGQYCIHGKAFCFAKSSYDVENKNQPIFENIRQLLLWNSSADSGVKNPVSDYIEGFYENCYDSDDNLKEYLYKCSERVKDLKYKREAIDSALSRYDFNRINGREEGFSLEEGGYRDLMYKLFDNEDISILIESASPGNEPAIIINEVMMFSGGNLDGLNVLNLVCRSFYRRPDICDNFDEVKVPWYIRKSPTSSRSFFALFLKLVFVGFIIALAALCYFQPQLVRDWTRKVYDPYRTTSVDAELASCTKDTSFIIEEFESS